MSRMLTRAMATGRNCGGREAVISPFRLMKRVRAISVTVPRVRPALSQLLRSESCSRSAVSPQPRKTRASVARGNQKSIWRMDKAG